MKGAAKTIKKIHKIRKRKSVWRNKYFWFFIVVFVIAGTGFYCAAFSSYFQTNQVAISGCQKVDSGILQRSVEEKVNRKLLLFFTKSIFLLNIDEIKEALLAQFPQIAQIKFQRILPDTLAIEIRERTPAGRWCQNNQCYLADENAVIFEESAKPDNRVILTITSDETKPLKLGDKVLDEEKMKNILEIQKTAKERFEIEIKEITISAKRLTAKTDEGWEIYFDINNDIQQQIFNLGALLDKYLQTGKRQGLEYVDLRFGNKVYYK